MFCTLGFCKGKLVWWADDKDLGQRIISSSRYDEPLKNVHTTFSPCCCSNPSLLRRMLPTRIIRSRAGHTRHASKRRAPKSIFFLLLPKIDVCQKREFFVSFLLKSFSPSLSIFPSENFGGFLFQFSIPIWYVSCVFLLSGSILIVDDLYQLLVVTAAVVWYLAWWCWEKIRSMIGLIFSEETTETSLLNSVHQIFLLKIPVRDCWWIVTFMYIQLRHFSCISIEKTSSYDFRSR